MKHHELTDMSYIDSIDSDGNYHLIQDEYDEDEPMVVTPEQYEVSFGPSPAEKFYHMVDTKMDELANRQYVPAGEVIDLLLDARVAYAALFLQFHEMCQNWLNCLKPETGGE